jgi:hypothetical protein
VSRRQWVLSFLIVYHVIAIVVHAIPDPRDLKRIDPDIRRPVGDIFASHLTPAFDRFATWLPRLESTLFAVTQPLRQVTRPYIRAGLRQDWTMFTDVSVVDQYLRVDYYVRSQHSQRLRRIQELVYPMAREDRVRVLHDFRDKAIFNLLESYFASKGRPHPEKDAGEGLLPLVRYFTNRYRTEQQSDGETLVRTEIWYGRAPIPAPGRAVSDDAVQARLNVLSGYYLGPAPSAITPSSSLAPGAQEREADIVWILEDVRTL